ncbi:MAG: hypothetical protein ACE5KX_03255 [Acidimicrobiia bacterium]
MGQQPNIELSIEDLPRPTPRQAAPRRWSPKRPGDLGAPEEVPWGGMFGTPGPDAGYALVLLQERGLPIAGDEEADDVETALADLMAARASHYGRAPVGEDAEVAELILGYRLEGVDTTLLAELAELRRKWLAGLAHRPEKRRNLVAAVKLDALAAKPDEVRRRLGEGERLIDG